MKEYRWEKSKKNGEKLENEAAGRIWKITEKDLEFQKFQFSPSVIITILPSNFINYTQVPPANCRITDSVFAYF